MTPPASQPGSSPSRMPGAGSIAKFLGSGAVSAGPFSVLGLSPESCTEVTILAAVDRQLDRLATHPEAETPEADEVRLAIHSAAAQLLDPPTRKSLIERWPKILAASSAGVPVTPVIARDTRPIAAVSVNRPRAPVNLDAELQLALAMHGGWNSQSMAMIQQLAAAKRGAPADIAVALERLHAPRQEPSVVVGKPTPNVAASRLQVPERAPSDEDRRQADTWASADPSLKVLRNAIVGGLVGVIVIAVGVGIVLMNFSPGEPGPTIAPERPTPVDARVPGDAAADPVLAKAGDTAKPSVPSPAAVASVEQLQTDLLRAATLAESDAQRAGELFASRARLLSQVWPSLPRDRVVAANDAVLGYLYRVIDRPEALAAAIQAISSEALPTASGGRQAASGGAVAASVWSSGMLARLSGENELPASARLIVQQRLAASIGQGQTAIESSFEAGAMAALFAWPARLTPPTTGKAQVSHSTAGWKTWADGAVALAGNAPSQRDRLILAGLEHLLLAGPEASADAPIRATVADLAQRLDWREQGEARKWLLAAFDDDRFSTGDLSIVTGSLALASSAKGVDPTMALSAGADEQARLTLRDRYAEAWGVRDAVDRGELLRQLESAMHAALATSSEARNPVEHLAAVIRLSRVSEGAWWMWSGDREGATSALAVSNADIDQVLEVAGRDVERSILEGSSSDGEWSLRYKAVGNNVRGKLDMFDSVARLGTLGPVDAETLAGEAFFGQPADVRTRAADALGLLGASPAVVNAALEVLPRVAKSQANSRLIEGLAQARLPSPRDPNWPHEARRVLVERLLQMAASGSETRAIDRLSRLLLKSYAARGLTKPQDPTERAGTLPQAHVSAFAQWTLWRRQADSVVPRSYAGFSLAQLDARRAARLANASGLVETFAAEQASLVELMAYVVVAERPSVASKVTRLMDELGEQRRSASHILEQAASVEAAIAQLWLMRLSGGPAA